MGLRIAMQQQARPAALDEVDGRAAGGDLLCSKPSNMLCPFLHLTMCSVGKYHGAYSESQAQKGRAPSAAQHETRTLAQFVAQIQLRTCPSLIDECKIAVLDTFAAGFVGALQPWAQRVVDLVRALGGTPEASVMHQAWQTDISRAALANGALIGAFECEPLTGRTPAARCSRPRWQSVSASIATAKRS